MISISYGFWRHSSDWTSLSSGNHCSLVDVITVTEEPAASIARVDTLCSAPYVFQIHLMHAMLEVPFYSLLCLIYLIVFSILIFFLFPNIYFIFDKQ